MSENKELRFKPVVDPNQLLPALKERLPESCFVYNQVIIFPNFKEDLSFFTLGNEINSSTWIAVIYRRDDYGIYFSISAPTSIVNGNNSIPGNIKEAFSSWSMIDWDETMVFPGLEKAVSAMIVDISANEKGNVTEIHPSLLFYMDQEEALKLEVESSGPDFQVKRLESEENADFITKGWKYSKEGSQNVFWKSIQGAVSAGVFQDGKCVSGVIITGVGVISALYTKKEFRGRGFAKLIMRYAFKESAKEGYVPCSIAEAKNRKSIEFHQSLLKTASAMDWIAVKKLEVD